VELAAKKTPCTPQELVTAVAGVWGEVVTDGTPLTLACVCVLASQWAIETAEGEFMICWNIGNFKWTRNPVDPFCQFATTEVVDGVSTKIVPPARGCQFMAYSDLSSGVRAWLTGLSRRWTLAWPCALAGDPDGFAQGLHDQKPPYYTAPVAGYIAGMREYFDPFMQTLTLPPDPLADTFPP
jgi:hypothetical protein